MRWTLLFKMRILSLWQVNQFYTTNLWPKMRENECVSYELRRDKGFYLPFKCDILLHFISDALINGLVQINKQIYSQTPYKINWKWIDACSKCHHEDRDRHKPQKLHGTMCFHGRCWNEEAWKLCHDTQHIRYSI